MLHDNYIVECLENVLLYGDDPVSKCYLTDDEIHIVELCSDYIVNTLFENRDDFIKIIDYYEEAGREIGWLDKDELDEYDY